MKFHANDFISRRRCEGEGLECSYRLGKFLGEGAYGAVHACTHLDTGAERAVKIMEKSEAKAEMNKEVIDEYLALKELDHPNLIRAYELIEDDSAFYIITDLCQGGDMLDELDKLEESGGFLKEEDAAVLVNNILSCINYCHQKGLCHRDLKLENILLHDSDYRHLKIIDFGLAKKFDDKTRFSDLVGTAYYMAPEVLDQDYGSKVDLWSLGIIAFMVLGGYAPFEGRDDREILEAIVNGYFTFNDPAWDNVSENAKNFIQLLLVEENDRPTAEEALQHPWLTSHRNDRGDCDNRRESTRASLLRLSSFHSRGSILKQATCAMMASQLSHCQDVKDIGLAFHTLDKNCRGSISKDDFRSFVASLYTNTNDDSESEEDSQEFDVDGLFEQVNISGTGTIHYSEFVGACLLQKNILEADKLKTVFQSYDKDNKGYITRDNLKTVLSCNSRVSDSTIDKIMRQTDLSGSGKISFQEFCDKMVGPVSLPKSAASTHPAVQRSKLIMPRLTPVHPRQPVAGRLISAKQA